MGCPQNPPCHPWPEEQRSRGLIHLGGRREATERGLSRSATRTSTGASFVSARLRGRQRIRPHPSSAHVDRSPGEHTYLLKKGCNLSSASTAQPYARGFCPMLVLPEAGFMSPARAPPHCCASGSSMVARRPSDRASHGGTLLLTLKLPSRTEANPRPPNSRLCGPSIELCAYKERQGRSLICGEFVRWHWGGEQWLVGSTQLFTHWREHRAQGPTLKTIRASRQRDEHASNTITPHPV